MIAIEQYATLKAQGLITLARVGSAYLAAQDRFDPSTGIKTAPEVQALDLDAYRAEAVRLQAIIAQIETLITDCLALP